MAAPTDRVIQSLAYDRLWHVASILGVCTTVAIGMFEGAPAELAANAAVRKEWLEV